MARIATIVGARPQFIKAGPLSRALAARSGIDEFLIHTGQHFDDKMSAVFFRELGLPDPRYNLGIGATSHGAMTGRMLESIEAVLLQERPDLVVVYGDTNSTLAGALASAKLHIPVAHVEAGLRSFNRRMPEEINRIVTDHVATLQFCPTQNSVDQLRREGVTDHVHHVGDVMYDATLYAVDAMKHRERPQERLGLSGKDYAVCTVHRAENTDDPARLAAIVEYLTAIARTKPLVFPLHPRTGKALARDGLSLAPAIIVEPLGYFDLHGLLADASEVYTDSGGLQKEAYFHRKPCVTLRHETEWVETVEAGWNRLWHGPDYVSPRRLIDDYGSGTAAEQIVAQIEDFLETRSADHRASAAA